MAELSIFCNQAKLSNSSTPKANKPLGSGAQTWRFCEPNPVHTSVSLLCVSTKYSLKSVGFCTWILHPLSIKAKEDNSVSQRQHSPQLATEEEQKQEANKGQRAEKGGGGRVIDHPLARELTRNGHPPSTRALTKTSILSTSLSSLPSGGSSGVMGQGPPVRDSSGWVSLTQDRTSRRGPNARVRAGSQRTLVLTKM